MTGPLTHQIKLIRIGIRLVMLAFTTQSLVFLWISDIRLSACIMMTIYLIGITLLSLHPPIESAITASVQYFLTLRSQAHYTTED